MVSDRESLEGISLQSPLPANPIFRTSEDVNVDPKGPLEALSPIIPKGHSAEFG